MSNTTTSNEAQTALKWDECKELSKKTYLQIEATPYGKFTVKGPDDEQPFRMFDTVEGLLGFLVAVQMCQDHLAVSRFTKEISTIETVMRHLSPDAVKRISRENVADVLDALNNAREGKAP